MRQVYSLHFSMVRALPGQRLPYMLYGMQRKHWTALLPDRAQGIIVTGWNRLVCFFYSHDDIIGHLEGDWECSHCGAHIPACTCPDGGEWFEHPDLPTHTSGTNIKAKTFTDGTSPD